MAELRYWPELDTELLHRAQNLRAVLQCFPSAACFLGPLTLVLWVGSMHYPDGILILMGGVFRWMFLVTGSLNLMLLLAWGYFTFRYGQVLRTLESSSIPYKC